MRALTALLVLLLGAPPPPAFRLAVPGYSWRFPRDDGAHPEFANEWWYFTGNLRAADGARFGFELTFFRISPQPGAALDHDLYFTHFAVTDITGRQYHFTERAHRGNWQQAGVVPTATGFRLFNENWTADFDATGPRQLSAVWGGQRVQLKLQAGVRILNGINGYSRKGDAVGQASYYYSLPRLAAGGEVDGKAVEGEVWMDHEFASNQLAADQQGWDWIGLQLANGDNLMLFNLRRVGGGRDPHSAGTLNGRALTAAEFQMTPTRWWQGYPIGWRVTIPGRRLALHVDATLDDQEAHAPATGADYWEGAVTVSGGAGTAAGVGYLELTGYRARLSLLDGGTK